MHRKIMENPFIVTGKIKPEYFCDRVEESGRLVRSILSGGENVVIISPRRLGKTGLINFCFEKPEVKEKVTTIIRDNIDNPLLSTKYVAAELGMTTRNLYRQLQGITSDTPSAIIKETRLERARSLLAKSELTVEEIIRLRMLRPAR